MLYSGGAVIYSDAVKACTDLGASLLTAELLSYVKEYVTRKTEYKDVDGKIKYTVIWLGKTSDTISNNIMPDPDVNREKPN